MPPPPSSPPEPPSSSAGFSWLAFIGGAFGPWTVLPLFLLGGWARTGMRVFVGLLGVLVVAGVVCGIWRKGWGFLAGLLAGIVFVAAAAAIKLNS